MKHLGNNTGWGRMTWGTEGKGIDYYASYPEAKSSYAKDKFKYDNSTDTYTCPEGNILTMQKQTEDGKICQYSNEEACASCKNCSNCTKAKDGIRRIERDMENDKIREKAKCQFLCKTFIFFSHL